MPTTKKSKAKKSTPVVHEPAALPLGVEEETDLDEESDDIPVLDENPSSDEEDFRLWREYKETGNPSIRERIMGNTRPTLLVAGERETAFDEGRDHAAKAPHVEVHRVAAGHSPNAETPDVFNALVVEFLARQTR